MIILKTKYLLPLYDEIFSDAMISGICFKVIQWYVMGEGVEEITQNWTYVDAS